MNKNVLRSQDAFTASKSQTATNKIAQHEFLGTTLIESCLNWTEESYLPGGEPRTCLVRTLEENDTIYKDFNKNCIEDDAHNLKCTNARKILVDLAARIINENCSRFTEKVFTTKLVGDAVTDVIRDALPLGSAATAVAHPATAIGLSMSTLLLNSYDKADQQLFLRKTFQTFDRAIKESTQSQKLELMQCRNEPTYMACSIYATLEALKKYSSSCSFKSALSTIDDALRDAGVSKSLPLIEKKVDSINTSISGFSTTVSQVNDILASMKDNPDIPQLKSALALLKDSISDVNDKVSKLTPATPPP